MTGGEHSATELSDALPTEEFPFLSKLSLEKGSSKNGEESKTG